jgi:hypothetical protein
MTRLGVLTATLLAVLALAGCATDVPEIHLDTPVEIMRQGGDMGIDDKLVIQPDGSWTYTSSGGPTAGGGASRSGKLSAEKVSEARAILQRPGFAEEISVERWEAHCIDPPSVVVQVGDRQSTFVSCDDPDQKNMNDLLRLLLEEVYNKTGT